MWIRIAYLSFMRYGSSDEKWRGLRLSPPRDLPAFHESVLLELLDERVSPRRSRSNHRGIKRQVSHWPKVKREKGKTQYALGTIVIAKELWVRPSKVAG